MAIELKFMANESVQPNVWKVQVVWPLTESTASSVALESKLVAWGDMQPNTCGSQ